MHYLKKIKPIVSTARKKKSRIQDNGLFLTIFVKFFVMSLLRIRNYINMSVQHENDTDTGKTELAPVHININLWDRVQFSRSDNRIDQTLRNLLHQ